MVIQHICSSSNNLKFTDQSHTPSLPIINSSATMPTTITPVAPDAASGIFAPFFADAVAEAAIPLAELDADDSPDAAPPVAVDSFAFNCASACGRSDAVTPVPLLHVLGITSAMDVNVMSAH